MNQSTSSIPTGEPDDSIQQQGTLGKFIAITNVVNSWVRNWWELPEETKYNHPCDHLLAGGRRRDYIDICVPLIEASINGDWKAVGEILHNREYLVRYSITENWETILHIAATGQSAKFVKHLVEIMENEDLKLQNKQGNTALCLAAEAGNVEIAKILVEKNHEVLNVRGVLQMMPLYLAVVFGKNDMVNYLYGESQDMTGTNWTDQDRYAVFLKCIEVDLFDVALRILSVHGVVLLQDDECARTVLYTLAQKPNAFNRTKQHNLWKIYNSIIISKMQPDITESEAIQLLRKVWENTMEKPKDKIEDILRVPDEENQTNTSPTVFVAAEMGNTTFLIELIRKYPDLIWMRNDNNQSIFHVAVSHRHESIYNLLYEIGSLKDLITPVRDLEGNNMLHLVGLNAEKNPLEDMSGAAFQLQRELLWFKEVEAMIPLSYRKYKNLAGKTPHQLFTENHKDLVSQGEKWMKGTANQCMVVAALITTIVFAVAFTIPGGYDQNTGFPVFLRNGPFIAFVLLDAISLILSSASILMFLSILTSRYAQKDFLKSLPTKLMIGLGTLFLSIITMMMAFAVSFFVLYRSKFVVIPIVISVVAVAPVFLYAKLQFPLLLETYRSTYGSRYLFKPKKSMLYYKTPEY